MLRTHVRRRTHRLMFEPVPESERLQVFVMMQIEAALDWIRSHARLLQPGGQIPNLKPTHQSRDEFVELRLILQPSRHRGEAFIAGRIAKQGGQCLPIPVATNRNRYPAFDAMFIAAPIRAMRSITVATVAASFKHPSVG